MEDGTDGDESQRSEFGLATALGADEQVDDVLGSIRIEFHSSVAMTPPYTMGLSLHHENIPIKFCDLCGMLMEDFVRDQPHLGIGRIPALLNVEAGEGGGQDLD